MQSYGIVIAHTSISHAFHLLLPFFLIWGNLIFVPVLAWWAWANGRLTLLGIILLGVYWVASLIFRFVILRRTKKEDYGSYDLKTLVERESKY